MLLIAIKGKHTQIVFDGGVKLCGFTKTKLIKSGNWTGGSYFQIGTIDGYKNVPILRKKISQKN